MTYRLQDFSARGIVSLRNTAPMIDNEILCLRVETGLLDHETFMSDAYIYIEYVDNLADINLFEILQYVWKTKYITIATLFTDDMFKK